jgi:hypothetical protein
VWARCAFLRQHVARHLVSKEAAMRRISRHSFVAILGASTLLTCTSARTRAEEAPGYWAGNVSLQQPRSMPAIDDAEAAPIPRPTSAPLARPSRRVQQAMYAEPIAAPVTNQTQQALNFYGGYSARATLNQMPRRTPIQPAAVGQMTHSGKPFQGVTTTTTVSPYLNLFRDDNRDTESIPSYFAFVRPQLEQQDMLAKQQRELDRLGRQLQRRPTSAAAYQSTGGPARYMDTAQFYGGWRK